MDTAYILIPCLIAGLLTGRLFSWIFPHDSTLLPGIPILGNIIALGRHGVAFISKSRKQFGDVFTLSLCGKYMTFLFDPAIIETFFRAPDSEITFRPAVQQFTQRVFGLPSKEFFPKHAGILRDLRHMLVPAELRTHAIQLAGKVFNMTEEMFPQGQQVELFQATRSVVFRSAVASLFGDGLAACAPGGAAELESTFFKFEDAFELAASPFPHSFQPVFTDARTKLLRWLRLAHQQADFGSTTAGQLVIKAQLRSELAPNMLLAVLWASQANTVPATFWAVAMLLLPENSGYAAAVLEELRQDLAHSKVCKPPPDASNERVKEGEGPSPSNASAAEAEAALTDAAYRLAINRKSTISRCVAEAVRLRVHSIDLRIAASDLELTSSTGEKVRLPKGRLLAICPFETHHSSELYPPNAWCFDPDRAPLTLGEGSAVAHSLAGLAFGGGSYRCPGRFFAEMEVALLVQLLLWQFELTLVNGHSAASASAEISPASSKPAKVAGDSQTDPTGPGAAIKQPSGLQQHGAGEQHWLQQLSPLIRCLFGERSSSWGWGLFEDSGGAQPGQQSMSAAPNSTAPADSAEPPGKLEDWKSSGDVSGLLPACNLHRLVGLKIPSEPCLVHVQLRRST